MSPIKKPIAMKLQRKYWLIPLTVLLFSCAKDESILFTQTVLQEPEKESLAENSNEETAADQGNQDTEEPSNSTDQTPAESEDETGGGETQTDSENGTDSPTETSVICATEGGMATESGLKTWCWGDVELPDYTAKVGTTFSNGQLKISSECFEKQVSKEGDRLKFSINPTYPQPGSWCSNSYNMRAEISTEPGRSITLWELKSGTVGIIHSVKAIIPTLKTLGHSFKYMKALRAKLLCSRYGA